MKRTEELLYDHMNRLKNKQSNAMHRKSLACLILLLSGWRPGDDEPNTTLNVSNNDLALATESAIDYANEHKFLTGAYQ